MPEELNFDTSSTLFAEVALPVPIPKLFTYRIPSSLNASVRTGQRVIVPFGQKKIITGVIARLHEQPPKEYEAKYILEVLEETEVFFPLQFNLYRWIANYYMCSFGEVLNAAMPSGLKLSSESMVQLNPEFNGEETQFEFSEKEWVLINRLKSDALTYTEAATSLGARNIYSILKSLTSRGAVLIFEQIKEKYKPKTEKYLRLSNAFVPKKKMEELFETLTSKPKQESVVLKYLQHVPVFSDPEANRKGISKSTLLQGGISESSLATLIKNNIVEEFDIVVPRFGFADPVKDHPLILSVAQTIARNEIMQCFREREVVLLQGVTGSGKTEIYIDLIQKALDGGSQVLYLLPEIAITTQIVRRLQKIFGAAMGVYHSRFSDNERVEVWNGVLSGKFKLVIGVRSSVFLPFDNLGLIVVDEEHDNSYKQHEPAPRYNARDVAMVMGQHHHAKVLLGSATPSLESFYQSQQKKYGWVTLDERYGDARLPEIIFANSAKERQRKTNKGEFTSLLLNSIKETVAKKDQVIIFQNRRGYSPMIRCEDCGWVPTCIQCSVSLTYHQFRHAMICHYCGYREDLPSQCPVCSSKRIQTPGYGTEKLEEELKLYLPEIPVQRMDLDTTRNKTGYETIIENFESGETGILVGTQMVTKGLDFDRVSLVGIFDADRMIHFPDFRSYERAFQLITQVSGRSGRRAKQGKVIIQTSSPDHPIFQYVLRHDVNGFIQEQLTDRQLHFYPPFSRLIEITVRHNDKKTSHAAAFHLTEKIQGKLKGLKILGPGEPMIARLRNEYLMTILIKIPRDQGKLNEIKNDLLSIAESIKTLKEYRSLKIVFDADPT